MRKELRYFVSVVAIFLLASILLIGLFRKYAILTIGHLWDTCKTFTSSLVVNLGHYFGFILMAFILIILSGLFLRSLFSYIKTKRKLGNLMRKQTSPLPRKLEAILSRNKIKRESLVLVNENKDCALTIGWFSPKVVISKKLTQKLDAKELEAVVLHEYYHLKNKHPLLLVVSEILSSSFILFPILKDITAQMRVILEKEADFFVLRRQKTARYLNLALDLVEYESRFEIYPNFSHPENESFQTQKRNSHKVNKFNLIVSLSAIIFGILLSGFPGNVHIIQAQENLNIQNCDRNICSLDCFGEEIYQDSSRTPPHTPSVTLVSKY